MRTSSKLIIISVSLMCAAFLPILGNAKRIADAARASEVSTAPVTAEAHGLSGGTPVASEEAASPQTLQTVIEARKDLCIGAMVWGEARGEPLMGKLMAAYVGYGRAVDGWFNSHDPCIQVCKHRGAHREFDGTKHFCAQIESAFKSGGQLPTVPEEFVNIAEEVRSGKFKPPEECRNVRFFANFAESSPGGIKDFQKNTKIRCVYGNHLFAEEKPKVNKQPGKTLEAHKRAKTKLASSAR